MSPAADRAPIPVVVLTGFLGAGKTTLLNEALAGGLPDTLVVVNEFGEAGLDHVLVEASVDTVTLLEGGCACCSSRGDLASTLVHIAERIRLGTLPRVARIVVETSGIADPAPVGATLATPAAREAGFVLGAIVAVADALYGSAHLAARPEARRQIAMADTVILTKADLAGPAALARLEGDVRALNPAAPIVCKTASGSPLADACAAGTTHDTAALRSDAHGQGHGHEVGTVTIRRADALPWPAFADWLSAVVSLRGAEILRVKGLVHCVERDRPVLVQGVHHWLDAPRLAEWPGVPMTTLTFITTPAAPADLARSLACAVSGAAPTTD